MNETFRTQFPAIAGVMDRLDNYVESYGEKCRAFQERRELMILIEHWQVSRIKEAANE